MTSEIFPKMRKVYYIYNPQTQTYDRIYPTVRQRALSILRRLFIGMGLGAGSFIVLLLIFGSPSEKELRKENSKLQAQYNVLSRRLDEAMGGEVLEEDEMEPFVTKSEPFVSGKVIGLFGSYGWGDGQWMRDWEARMAAAGAKIQGGTGVICQEAPDEEALERCRKLGRELSNI